MQHIFTRTSLVSLTIILFALCAIAGIFFSYTADAASIAVGSRVQTTDVLKVRGTASPTGPLLGTQSLGGLGTIVSGPIVAGGYTWWNINYDSGVDGWSAQDFLISVANTKQSTVAAVLGVPTPVASANPVTTLGYTRSRTGALPTITKTPAELMASKLVLPYDASVAMKPWTYGTYTYKPGYWDEVGLSLDIGTTGERQEIGLVTDAIAIWLTGGSANNMLAQAEAHGSSPVHYRVKNGVPSLDGTGTMVDITDPLMKSASSYENPDAVGAKPWFDMSTNNNGIRTDLAHYPNLDYVPFLATGDLYYLQELQDAATYALVWGNPNYRQFEKGFIDVGQVRGYAWALGLIASAYIATPDNPPAPLLPKSYWKKMLDNNRDQFNAQWVKSTLPIHKLGFITNEYVIGSDGSKSTSPWQQDFLSSVIGWMIYTGQFPDWQENYQWSLKSALLRANGLDGFPRSGANGYWWNTGNVSTGAQLAAANGITASADGNYPPDHADYAYAGYLRGTLRIAMLNGVAAAAEGFTYADAQAKRIGYIPYKWAISASGAVPTPTPTPTPTPVPAPTVVMFATPTSVTSGSASTLTWSSTNATACTGTGFTTGSKTFGTVSVSPSATTNYSVSCTGASGTGSANTTVTVTAAPAPTPKPGFVSGARVITTDILNVRGTASPTGTLLGAQPQSALGTIVGGPTVAGGYTWWNINYDSGVDGWSVQDFLLVTTIPAPTPVSTPAPIPAPTVLLTSAPASVVSGSASTLTWTSTNATACTGTGFNTGTKTFGSVTVNPTITTSYSVSCTGASGTTNANMTVTVNVTTATIPTVAPSSGVTDGKYTWTRQRPFKLPATVKTPQELSTSKLIFPISWSERSAKLVFKLGEWIGATDFSGAEEGGVINNESGEWLAGGDPNNMLVLAESHAALPIHFINQSTGRLWSIFETPKATIYPKGQTINPTSNSPVTGVETAHYPAFTALAYAATGDIFYLEELQFAANFHILALNPDYRMDASKTVDLGLFSPHQMREWTWELRDIAWAYLLTPEGDVAKPLLPKSYWKKILDNNRDWVLENWVRKSHVTSGIHMFPIFGGDVTTISPWQQDMVGATLGWMISTGQFSDWREIYDWQIRQAVDRASGKSGFPRSQALGYWWKYSGASDMSKLAAVNNLTETGNGKFAIIPGDSGLNMHYGELLEANLNLALKNGVPGAAEALAYVEPQIQPWDARWALLATNTQIPVPVPADLFLTGARVSTIDILNVRGTASPTGTLLGAQPQSALGTIVGGPITAGGFVWWNVNYDSGVDGWSVQDFLVTTTIPAPTPVSTPAPIPAPTVLLTSTPSSVTSGLASILTWTSTNATACTGTGFNTGTKTFGSVTVNPTITTSYSVSCTGASGTTNANMTVTVTQPVPVPAPTPTPVPAPTVTLTASPASITSASGSTLTWSSTNATACTGTGFSTGSSLSGSVSVTPSVTTSYSLSCTGTSGTASKSATVTVSPIVSPTPLPIPNPTPTPVPPAQVGTFSIGDRVKTIERVNVYRTPSTLSWRYNRVSAGALGTIMKGPTTTTGSVWWNVKFEDSRSGWVLQKSLVKATTTTTIPTPTTVPTTPVPTPTPIPTPTPTPTPTASTLIIRASSDYEPQFKVYVNGTQVGTTQTVTGMSRNTEWRDISITGDFSSAQTVDIKFFNDGTAVGGGDINLYVDYITLGGVTYQAENAMFDRGANVYTPGTGTQNMYWDSTLRFTVTPVTATAPIKSTLVRGITGPEVATLQTILAKLGLFKTEVTGYFGTATESAVKNLQSANSIEAIGIVGPKTRELLKKLSW